MIKKIVVCPNCKGKIEVTNENDLQFMQVKCPNPVCPAQIRIDFTDDLNKTQMGASSGSNTKIGSLRLGSRSYPLQEGRNTIGRGAPSSKATVQLETADKSMSREHAVIEVVRLKSGRVKAILSDLRQAEKAKQRPLMVEDVALTAGDRISLAHGDVITLGDTEVKYIQE